MIKIHVFHTGSVRVDRAIPYKEANPFAVTGLFRSKDKKIVLPVSCYLIEHPKGRILIDTGWDSKYIAEKPHRFFGLLDNMSTPIVKEGQSIDCKLAKLGLTDRDIDYIFFSHMDFDHTSGLRLVQNAKHIMASEEEIKDSKKYFFRYVKTNWDFSNIKGFHYDNTGIGPVGKSFDVFGDGSVVLVNTPGHTNGLFTAIIKNDSHYVALAGDTVYTQKSWEDKIIPGFTVNKKLAQKSLHWICSLVEDPNCIAVLANHDPKIKEQIIEL